MGKHLAKSKNKHLKPEDEQLKLDFKLRIPNFKGLIDSFRADQAKEEELEVKEEERLGEEKLEKADVIFVIILFALFSLLYILPTAGWVRFASYVIVAALACLEVLREAADEIAGGRFFDQSVLTILAALCCFVAGRYIEAAFVVLFYRLCMLIEAYLEDRRRQESEGIEARFPEKAYVETADDIERISPRHLNPGDIVVVYPGEVIPADGIIIEGISAVNFSAVTGNAASYAVGEGSQVYAGSVNSTNQLRVKVGKPFEESVIFRTAETVADSDKIISRQEWSSSRSANLIVPIVCVLAVVLTVIVSVSGGNWRGWLCRAAVFFAVTNFSLLGTFINSAYFGVVHKLLRRGVVFNGYDAVEALGTAETMVFNKTGTLTEQEFTVVEICPKNIGENELLVIAAMAEGNSQHPVARALRSACGLNEIPEDGSIMSVEDVPGRGVSAFIRGRHVLVGNAAHLMDHGLVFMIPSTNGNTVHVAIDNEYAGYLVLAEKARSGAFDALEELRVQGVNTMVMLTGDGMSTSRRLASSLNFDMVKADLKPEAKASAVEYLMATKTRGSSLVCVFDAHSRSVFSGRPDLGIVVDALGEDAVLSGESTVILDGDIRKLADAHLNCVSTLNTVKRILLVAACVKCAMLLFALLGVVVPWFAVIADFAVMVYALYKTLKCF